jgi:hypothetical protein
VPKSNKKEKELHTHTHTYENYNCWLTNFGMIIQMANRLMKQITLCIHQAGPELMYVDRKNDEAESGLLHLFVTNKLRQAATQPLKNTVF